MRIAYNNLVDGIASTSISALTVNSSYPVANMQDQRLTTKYRSTAATSQSLTFDAGGAPNFIGDAYTNLVADPTDLTTANWTATNATATAQSATINGNAFTKVSNSGAAPGYVVQNFTSSFTNLILTGQVTCRKGSTTDNIATFLVQNTTAPVTTFQCAIDFDDYPSAVTAAIGTLLDYTWLDSETIVINFQCVPLVNLTDDVGIRCYGANNTTAAEYTLWTEVQLIDSAAITMYPFVSGTHSADEIDQAFVMPDKMTIVSKIDPLFTYDVGTNKYMFTFYVDATHEFRVYYDSTTDKFILVWRDGGITRGIVSTQFDDSTTYTNINQTLQFVISADLISGGTNDSRFMMFTEGGVKIFETATWDGPPDIKTTLFPALSVGNRDDISQANSNFEYFRVYGGLLTETITDSDDVTDALASRTAMLDLEYQGKFDFNTVALMGHNLSEGTAVTLQANDYDAWEYTTSGGSIIQSTMTWNKETILTFLTRTQKQYIKITMNDPNNTDDYIEVARPWIGQYIDISPSSLDDFTVIQKRSDLTQYGRNRQKWSNPGVGWREIQLSFPPTAEAMTDKIMTMYDTVGNHTSIIFCNFDSIRDYKIVEPMYCSIVGNISHRHHGRQRYNWDLTIEEDK